MRVIEELPKNIVEELEVVNFEHKRFAQFIGRQSLIKRLTMSSNVSTIYEANEFDLAKLVTGINTLKLNYFKMHVRNNASANAAEMAANTNRLFIEFLKNQPNLVELDLRFDGMSDDVLVEIANLKNLQRLTLKVPSRITGNFHRIFKLPNLSELVLIGARTDTRKYHQMYQDHRKPSLAIFNYLISE